jgi:hypothetical protein
VGEAGVGFSVSEIPAGFAAFGARTRTPSASRRADIVLFA